MEFEPGKLFVANLAWETNEINLKEHFSKYGQVKECQIILDKVTHCSRGFGFVSFTDPLEAEKALQEKHIILGRKADVKPAIPQGEKTQKQAQVDQPSLRTKKIFVGGLPRNLTTEEFKNYFDQFGTITNAVILEENGASRGFGFITFDSEEAVDDATRKTHYKLKQKSVEVKRADPNKDRKYKLVETYDCNNVGLDFGAIDHNNFWYYAQFCFSCLAPSGHEHQKGCLLYGQNFGGYYVAYPCGVPTRFWNEERLWNEGDLQTYFCPWL